MLASNTPELVEGIPEQKLQWLASNNPVFCRIDLLESSQEGSGPILEDSSVGIIYVNSKNISLNIMGFVKMGESQWKRIEQDKAIIKHHGAGFTVMVRFMD